MERLRRLSGENLYTALGDQTDSSYDTKAKMYEFLVSSKVYNRIFWGTSPDDYLHFARLALKMSRGRVLDVGCGGLSHTARLYADFLLPVVLLDRSLEMLQIGAKRIRKVRGKVPENISLVHADAFDLPYQQEFDTLLSFGMLHLFENKAAYLDSILSVLRPGGRFFISVLTTDRPFSRSYMSLLYKKNEMAKGESSADLMELFESKVSRISSYQIGSMLFISGHK